MRGTCTQESCVNNKSPFAADDVITDKVVTPFVNGVVGQVHTHIFLRGRGERERHRNRERERDRENVCNREQKYLVFTYCPSLPCLQFQTRL